MLLLSWLSFRKLGAVSDLGGQTSIPLYLTCVVMGPDGNVKPPPARNPSPFLLQEAYDWNVILSICGGPLVPVMV